MNEYKLVRYSEINPEILRQIFADLALNELLTEESLESRLVNELPVDVYPEISKWYEKVRYEVNQDPTKREIFFQLYSEEGNVRIVGLLIVKNFVDEKKICTIRIAEGYRCNGLGRRLFQQAFEYLGTNKPLMTLPEECLSAFQTLLEEYHFEKSREVKGMYRDNKIEYIYNEEALK